MRPNDTDDERRTLTSEGTIKTCSMKRLIYLSSDMLQILHFTGLSSVIEIN